MAKSTGNALVILKPFQMRQAASEIDMEGFKKIVLKKSYFIIYSRSCLSNPVWLFHGSQNKQKEQHKSIMEMANMLLKSCDSFVWRTNSKLSFYSPSLLSQLMPSTFSAIGCTTFLILLWCIASFNFVLQKRKKVAQVYNNMQVSKWWQTVHFWANYPFNLIHFEYCKVHMNKKKAECAPGDDETSSAGNVNLGSIIWQNNCLNALQWSVRSNLHLTPNLCPLDKQLK